MRSIVVAMLVVGALAGLAWAQVPPGAPAGPPAAPGPAAPGVAAPPTAPPAAPVTPVPTAPGPAAAPPVAPTPGPGAVPSTAPAPAPGGTAPPKKLKPPRPAGGGQVPEITPEEKIPEREPTELERVSIGMEKVPGWTEFRGRMTQMGWAGGGLILLVLLVVWFRVETAIRRIGELKK